MAATLIDQKVIVIGEVEVFLNPTNHDVTGTQKLMGVIVRLKKAHEFAHSPLEEREMLGIWPEQSVFVINSGVNPTVLTECPFRS
jgi:hypothetical protein